MTPQQYYLSTVCVLRRHILVCGKCKSSAPLPGKPPLWPRETGVIGMGRSAVKSIFSEKTMFAAVTPPKLAYACWGVQVGLPHGSRRTARCNNPTPAGQPLPPPHLLRSLVAHGRTHRQYGQASVAHECAAPVGHAQFRMFWRTKKRVLQQGFHILTRTGTLEEDWGISPRCADFANLLILLITCARDEGASSFTLCHMP